MEDGGDRRWARVRRQETVGHRQRSRHRHADIQQRHACRRGDTEDQRQQQHEANFIEQRKTDGKTGQYHRPLNVFLTELLDKRSGDALGAAAVRQQLAQHGAEAHDQRQAAQGAAHAGLDGADHFIDWHTLSDTHRQSNQNQRDKAVQLKADHQQQQQRDAACNNH
ncbi:hypothetical protein D3C80_528380 [compost metagenome]